MFILQELRVFPVQVFIQLNFLPNFRPNLLLNFFVNFLLNFLPNFGSGALDAFTAGLRWA